MARWPSLPYGHSHSEGATFVHADTIWMIGGHHTPAGEKKSFCGDILTLQAGGEWQIMAKLPKPISSPAASIIENTLYIAGGWDGRRESETKNGCRHQKCGPRTLGRRVSKPPGAAFRP